MPVEPPFKKEVQSCQKITHRIQKEDEVDAHVTTLFSVLFLHFFVG